MSNINEKNQGPRWYVAHTYTGYENKVKDSIEKMVENRGLGHLIYDIKVPAVRENVLDENGKPVLDKNGEEIELSELCNDEDNSRVNRADADAIDAILGQRVADDELRKSFLVDDEDDAEESDEDSDEFFGTEEEVYGEDFLDGSDDE